VDPRTLGCRDLATLALPALFLKSPLNTDFLSVTFSPIHGKYTKSPLRVHNKYTRPMTFENFPARHRTATSLPTCSFAQRSVRGTHPQAQRGSVTVRCSALLGVAYGGGGVVPHAVYALVGLWSFALIFPSASLMQLADQAPDNALDIHTAPVFRVESQLIKAVMVLGREVYRRALWPAPLISLLGCTWLFVRHRSTSQQEAL